MNQTRIAAIEAAGSSATVALANSIATFELIAREHSAGRVKLDPKLLAWVQDSALQLREALDAFNLARHGAVKAAA